MQLKRQDGTMLFYKHTTAKKTVVLLHGWGLNHSLWYDYVSFFKKKGYGILQIDLPGHGYSTNKHTKNTIETYAQDVLAIIKKEKIAHYLLIGHSMGSMVSQAVALADKKHCKGMVLLGSSARNPIKWYHFIAGYFTLIFNLLTQKKQKKPIDYETIKHASTFTYFYRGTASMSMKDVIRPVYAMARFNIVSKLKDIRCPTLVLTGSKDNRTAPALGKEIAQYIPKGKYIELAQEDHAVPFNNKKLVQKEITSFLKEL